MLRTLSGLALALLSFTVMANEAPKCDQATASPSTLWPVNHTMQAITVKNITDADNDPVSVNVLCISQDEPLDALGDGHFQPDGDGVGTSTALVRSERQGTSNGRFYHISFAAKDPLGASCTGTVKVSVAHSKNKTPIDEGRLYSSTLIATSCASQPQNHPPVIISLPLTQINETELYQYDVDATDAEGDTLTYSLASAPAGMTIDAFTGFISWLTSEADVGEHGVVVRVQDSNGAIAEQAFQVIVLNVNHPPIITSEPVTIAVVAIPYEYNVIGNDPDSDALAYQLVSAPQGMIINPATGLIQWLPTINDEGMHSITVRVTDTYAESAEQTYSLFVSNGYANNNHPPVITSAPLITAMQGQPYAYGVTATDQDNDAIKYTVSSAPEGLVVDANSGMISWTPQADQGGEQRVVIIGTDARGASTSQAYYINVDVLNNEPPVFVSEPETYAVPASIYIYATQATDPENDLLSYSLASAPTGMTINTDTGLIFWMPADDQAAQTVNVEVMATDAKGAQTVQAYSIVVSGIVENHAPQFITQPKTNAFSDALYTYESEAVDADINDSLTYRLLISPFNTTINNENGDLAWSPRAEYEMGRSGLKASCRSLVNNQLQLAPDLMVTNINITPENKVAVTIKNRGAMDATAPLKVALFQRAESSIDNSSDISLGEVEVAPLTVGSTQIVTVDVEASSLDQTLVASVNAISDIHECDLENNSVQSPLIKLHVEDMAGLSDEQFYALMVVAPNHTPYFAPNTDNAKAYVDIAFSYSPNGFDNDKGDGLIYRLVADMPAPVGLTVDQMTGVIHWTPDLTQIGEHSIHVEAVDTDGEKTEFILQLLVDHNSPPEIVSDYPTAINEFENYSYNADATDPDVNETQLWMLDGPDSFNIDSMTGVVNANAMDLASYVASVELNDNYCLRPPKVVDGIKMKLKFAWKGGFFYGPVMVGQTNDDNNDGKINLLDTPDMIFGQGKLYVVSGKTGTTLWSTADLLSDRSTPAIADIDADGIIEIIVVSKTADKLLAYEHNGQLKWQSDLLDIFSGSGTQISIADLDHDGIPEIIAGGMVLNNKGKFKSKAQTTSSNSTGYGPSSIVADIDMDGNLDIITGKRAFNGNGTLKWENKTTGMVAAGFNAVGNFDNDAYPEIVYNGSGKVYLLEHTGAIKWSATLPSDSLGSSGFGGAPTVADLDGDGQPEIGIAGSYYYFVFETNGTLKWKQRTQDKSSNRTGSSVYDFDGDGHVEILYADEINFYVFDGATGEVLSKIANTSSTVLEYPVVADIDNDGHAEIIVGGSSAGGNYLRVFEAVADDWTPTRSIWNQYAYHINNINDDGTVPRNETPSWESHNTYRLNLPILSYKMADLRLDYAQLEPMENGNYRIKINVKNRGLYATEPTELKIYQGVSAQGNLLGTLQVPVIEAGTTIPVYLDDVSGLADPQADKHLFAIVNASHAAEECHADNNTSLTPLLVVQVTDKGGLSDTQLATFAIHDVNQAPIITSTSPGNITAGQIWRYRLNINDPDVGDNFKYQLVGAPAGMDVYSDGYIRWKTSSANLGQKTFTVKVTDLAGHQVQQVVSFEVIADPNNPPVIKSKPASTIITLGQTYSYQVVATDAQNDPITYGLTGVNVPQGITINPATGLLMWTPTAEQMGESYFTITATDSHEAVGSQEIILTVVADNLAPVIMSDPIIYTVAGSSYAYTVEAYDEEKEELVYGLANAPSGMEINAATGDVTWDVPEGFTGNANITVNISDSESTVSQSWILTVFSQAPLNTAPQIISAPNTQASLDRVYHYSLQANDAEEDSLSWSLMTAPQGMTIDNATGIISWPVSADAVLGPVLVKVAVSDGHYMASQWWWLSVEAFVNSAPLIDSTPQVQANAGALYSYQAHAIDEDNDVLSWSLLEGVVGMELDGQTGELHWQIPADLIDSQIPVSLMVNDGINQTVQSWVLTVSSKANTAPGISSEPIAAVEANKTYHYQLIANDADNDTYVWSLESAPVGMVLDAVTGSLTWPATVEPGSYLASVKVTDARGAWRTQSWYIQVYANIAPQFITAPTVNVDTGTTYIYDANAFDAYGDSLTYQLIRGVPGMTIDSATGIVSWPTTEHDSGIYTIELQVSDAGGLSDTQLFNLQVLPPASEPPVVTPSTSPNAVVGYEYTYPIIAHDPENAPLSYQLSQAPDGMMINATTGLISWTPATTDVGNHNIIVIISDGRNRISLSYSLTVLAEMQPFAATVSLTPANLVAGQTTVIDADLSGGIAPYTVTLTIDGVEQVLDAQYRTSYTAHVEQAGSHSVIVTATDSQQHTTMATQAFMVYAQAESNAPQVSIATPLIGTEITAPTPVAITVADATLTEWRLSVRSAGDMTEGQVIATGHANVQAAAVTELDPTVLVNGQYELLLQAWDVGGQHSFASRQVVITGAMKVGNFAFTVEDMNISMLGLPVRISRTYNNFIRQQNGEVGYGWTLDYQNVKVQESIEPSRGWFNSPEYQIFMIDTGDSAVAFRLQGTCLRSKYRKLVSVTLPNGDVEQFTVRATNPYGSVQSSSDPDCYMIASTQANLEFVPKGDTQSTLTSVEGMGLALINENLVADITDAEAALISRYTLTTREGMKYELDQSFGIRKVIDPNGNTLTYSSSGITHSAGESLLFRRDAQQRIIGIRYANETQDRIRYGYNTAGDLVSQFDELGNRVQYTYDSQHGMLSLVDPLNRPLLNNFYDEKGRLTAQVDANGHRTEFNHDIAGRMESTQDRRGFTTTHYYDDHGYVTSTVNALNEQESFTYDALDNETSHTDAKGNSTAAIFNAKNDQLSHTDELGNTTTYSYNSRGQELQITDASGNSYHNSYDVKGNLIGIIDPLGYSASNTIEANGLVTSTTDVLGNVTRYTYDTKGRKKTETNPAGNVTTYSYNREGSVTQESRTRTVNGSSIIEITRYTYDAKQRVIKTTAADGSITHSEYDAVGNETASIDAKGRRTTMSYDTYGRLLTTTYPDGSTSSKTYDVVGNVQTETDAAGRVTTFEYDALNRVIKTTMNDGSFTRTEYDAVGNVQSEVDARGNRTDYEYDAAKRRTASINALNQRHTFSYDAEGQLTSETDANGHSTTYEYNAAGQKVKTIFHDATEKTDNVDALGRRTAQTDQNGIVTEYVYDVLGRLTGVVDAEGNFTGYSYDEAGNKLTQTDAEGRTTRWSYDAVGRVLTRQLPLGQTEEFTYDATGNVLTHTDFNGQVTTNTYNPLNDRLVQTTYRDGTSESFTYTADGQIHTATNTEGTTTYAYDTSGRLQTETKATGETLSYSYDVNGNRTSVTVTANGVSTTTTYTYDVLNRLSTATDAVGTTQYSYDAVGNRSAVVYPNAFSQHYQYNSLNRLTTLETQLNGTATERYVYTLDATGQRLGMNELNGRNTLWTYDALNRLESESIAQGNTTTFTASYQYDTVGNRIAETKNGITTIYSYDANDRITDAGNVAYSYDNNGNTLSETDSLNATVKTYSYNVKNQLTSANTLEGLISYGYDIGGIRNAKTENGITTHFITDSNRDYAQVLLEVEAGQITANYTYGDDLISQTQTAANDSRYYLYDGLGSTRALTDEIGNVTDQYEYDAFGNTTRKVGQTQNNYLYTGEQLDENLGQYVLRARNYSPEIGRFTQQDAYQGRMQEPVTLHKYLYTHSNPVNGIDPSGLMNLSEVGIAQTVQSNLLRFALTYPRTFGVIEATAQIATPFELAALNPVSAGLVGASSLTLIGVKHLDEAARLAKSSYWLNRIRSGNEFEKFIGNLIGQDSNTKRIILDGVERLGSSQRVLGSAVPDFFFRGGILEAKLTGSAVSKKQFEQLVLYSQANNTPLTYVFYNKPSEVVLKNMSTWLDDLGGGVNLEVAYILK